MLSIRHVECRSAFAGMSDVESEDAPVLILPLKGAFVSHFSRECRVLADPSVALILPPSRAYRVSHPAGHEDDCLVFEFSNSSFLEFQEASGIRNVGTHSLLSPPAMARRNLLRHRLERKFADPLEIEGTALDLLYQAMQDATTQEAPHRISSRMMEQIEEVRFAFLRNPEARWTLAMLAERVQSTPFHLTRSFHTAIGMPLHRYLLHTRIARAVDLLLDTNLDVTSIAFELGFSSHSHFTAVFRRLVGSRPHEFRRTATSRKTVQ